ncbi:glycosyltransferase family 4 protein [Dongia sedimenti]|uniref:Glycosyltransferase family 4 protein n=1 Tax=Dongia sedimenti TaxID=3064282 RepID=A0ABU0YP82_9PROT|nr:glycosyltransferase family 4 protein [Rhodospirillaceae bacterium R-7]
MRIAFYAPLKAPDHPVPSGDRTIARLLLAALKQGGATVEIASRIRTRLSDPTEAAQQAMARKGEAAAKRLIAKYRARPKQERPQAWFSYHLYYKAVDWIGPQVAAALDIPYLLAEASHAPKRAEGPYAFSHAAAEAAIRKADAIFCLNPIDRECVAPLVGKRRLIDLPPFLDLANFTRGLPDRAATRAKLARAYGIDGDQPWLLAVGMMRKGDKLASYKLLAEALQHLDRPWQLLIVGDGEARADVERAFKPVAGGVFLLGAQPREKLPEIAAAADLCVWPAVNEAFGMALLEAQACGLPVVAGAWGGVPAIIVDGKTGWLSKPGDATAFSADVDFALDADLAAIGQAARENALAKHDIGGAARKLVASIQKTIGQ